MEDRAFARLIERLMTMALETLTADNFDKRVTSAEGVVIVNVWATSSGASAPALDELTNEYAKKATWFKLDADENPVIVRKYDVSGTPTLLVFKGGSVIHSINGDKPKAELVELLSKFL